VWCGVVNLPLPKWEKLVVLEQMDFRSPVSSDSLLLGHRLQNAGRMKNKEQETMQKITQVTVSMKRLTLRIKKENSF